MIHDNSKKILKDICNIMYDNYKLFPIAQALYENSKHLSEEDHKTYVLISLELYSGIKYILFNKFNAIEEIWWQLTTPMFEPILKSTLKSVLALYIRHYSGDDKEEIEKFWKTIENY
jgi:hypothetical protein